MHAIILFALTLTTLQSLYLSSFAGAEINNTATNHGINIIHEPRKQDRLPVVEQAATAVASVESLVEKPSSINLGAILDHQAALELECAKYQKDRINQLKYLIRYQDDNHDQVQLPSPLAIKVPAVCLFLFSQFRSPEPMEPTHGRRLDLVNWIYDEKEIRGQLQASNKSKREISEPPAKQLIYDYILDPAANYSELSSSFNELDNSNSNDQMMIKFHQDVDTMMASEPYKQMIENNRNRIAAHLSPVILVPGLLGSRLQARVNKKDRVNIFCRKQNDWQDMWLSLRQLLPLLVDCWLDNVRLDYDPATGYTRSPEGIESRVPDFGSVESVRHIDLKSPKMTKYFAPIIERYEKLGYTPGLNLHAAPYDFRLAPQQMDGYFGDLRQLIEQAQDNNPGQKRVTLVCHSMGCTHLLIFLRSQTVAWRQARIRKMIALSSPWGGALKALKALVVGDQLELPLVSEAKMRKLARTYPSIAFLLPQPEIFTRANRIRPEPGGPVIVETPARSYRVSDLGQLMHDLGLDMQAKWFQETVGLIRPLEPLDDLHVDCIHSLNTPTPETLVFRNQSDFPDGNYELIRGEGDGTVNYESLMVCDDWARQLPDKVKHKVIINTNHVGVIGHKTTLTHLSDDVLTN